MVAQANAFVAPRAENPLKATVFVFGNSKVGAHLLEGSDGIGGVGGVKALDINNAVLFKACWGGGLIVIKIS